MGRGRARRWASLALVGVVGPTALVGCSSTTASKADPPGTLAPVQSGAVTVSARDNSFIVQDITVTVGSEITWRNDGRNDHNIVGVGDTPFHVDTAQFKPKDEFHYTVNSPGTYKYYCSIHGTADKGMIGTVQVVPR
jgi:plastocyanin